MKYHQQHKSQRNKESTKFVVKINNHLLTIFHPKDIQYITKQHTNCYLTNYTRTERYSSLNTLRKSKIQKKTLNKKQSINHLTQTKQLCYLFNLTQIHSMKEQIPLLKEQINKRPRTTNARAL